MKNDAKNQVSYFSISLIQFLVELCRFDIHYIIDRLYQGKKERDLSS
jgi:hypothetical protein